MVMPGERSLYYAIYQYLAYYHTERNHQGLDNQLIAPDADLRSHRGQVSRRERLGRLLEDVSEVLVCYSLGVYESQSNPQRNRVTR